MKNNSKDKLKKLENKYLLDIVANYQKYNYSKEIQLEAIKILKDRKVDNNLIEKYFEKEIIKEIKKKIDIVKLKKYYKNYLLYSLLCLFIYIISPLVIFKGLVLINFIVNLNEPAVNIVFIILNYIMIILFIIFSILSFINFIYFNYERGERYTRLEKFIINFILWIPVLPLLLLYNYFNMKKIIKMAL